MLKMLLASLGVNVDQAMVDKMMSDCQNAFASVAAMKASQDRTEAMVKTILAELPVGGFGEADPHAQPNITVADKVVLGKQP